jgi:hypothetical protein
MARDLLLVVILCPLLYGAILTESYFHDRPLCRSAWGWQGCPFKYACFEESDPESNRFQVCGKFPIDFQQH